MTTVITHLVVIIRQLPNLSCELHMFTISSVRFGIHGGFGFFFNDFPHGLILRDVSVWSYANKASKRLRVAFGLIVRMSDACI